ncbi:MAG: hypothetical protein Q8885_00580 [Candidatus Phytoplasma stylosanthis]|nr:hypothetical protein [Candidatus Phytoplasma stylosanthis]
MNKQNNKINKLILGWCCVISFVILTLSVIVFNRLETNPNQEINDLTTDVEKLKTENKNEITTENQKEIKTPKEIITPILATKPYIKYYDSEGNIIREYRFFKNMHPTQKDINGQIVFFDKPAFEDCLKQIGINCYPIQWTNGREHLGEHEIYSNIRIKYKHDWKVSKSNYQLIATNKPNEKTKLLTKDIFGVNSFYNKSWCFIYTCQNIDIFKTFSEEIDSENMPYLRLITKNLELEFDWLNFIAIEFKDYCSDNYKNISNYIYYFDPSENLEELNYDICNLSSTDFKAFQVLHRFNNNIDFNKFHDNYQYNLYFQYNRRDLIHWLNNLDLKNDKRLIKIREWAIYNMEQEQKQQEPEFTESNKEEFM